MCYSEGTVRKIYKKTSGTSTTLHNLPRGNMKITMKIVSGKTFCCRPTYKVSQRQYTLSYKSTTW